MTRPVEQAQFEDLMFKHPREPKETLTDWFDRLMSKASEDDRPRLPYREPGSDDE